MSNPNHEEELYAQAAAELEDGNRDEGLWAKCFAECDGDRNKARAHYLKTRVARLTANENRLATGPPSESAKPPVIDSSAADSQIANSFAGPTGVSSPPAQAEYQTVGGWLLLFCITLVICRPLVGLGAAAQDPFSETEVAREMRIEYRRIAGEEMSVSESNREARKVIADVKRNPALSGLFALVNIERIGNAVMAIFSFVCGCVLWARRRGALKLVKLFLWVTLGFIALDLLWAVYLDNDPAIREFTGMSMAEEAGGELAGALVYFGIWYTYILKSKRVKSTQWV